MSISDIINLLVAIVTCGSTIVALLLGLQMLPRRIKAIFVWESATNYQPMLLVQNLSNRVVVLKSIEITYCGYRACYAEFADNKKISDYAILEANQVVRIPLSKLEIEVREFEDKVKKYYLYVEVKQCNGLGCNFSTRMSYEMLEDRIFSQIMLND